MFSSGEVRARPKEDNEEAYLASGMSDGERVIFYLIGQCLCAPDQSIIIIDEPELHLHRSIQRRLWDAIEKERPDCQFVYITHDLIFAESRTTATKVWLQSSTKTNFNWTTIKPVDGIPDDLYLEVLGSRQPILFTEGTYDSIDIDIYGAVYPDFLVRPIGSCASVLQATKALREIDSIHYMRPFGLVDRDYLSQGQLDAYRNSGVGSPKVAEIENIFLTPEVLQVMCERLQVDTQKTQEVLEIVYSEFERKLNEHALALTKRDITLSLGRFSASASSPNELASSFSDFTANIDIQSIYNTHLDQAKSLLQNHEYTEILKTFNHKGLAKRVTGIFGLTKPNYLERARNMARKGDIELINALALYLPQPSEFQ